MIELVKVEDHGGQYLTVTFRMSRKLVAYFTMILDNLLQVARHLHWRGRIAAAERKALCSIYQVGHVDEVNRIRDEMIFFLKTELAWTTRAIADCYELTPQNVRKILSRRRRSAHL